MKKSFLIVAALGVIALIASVLFLTLRERKEAAPINVGAVLPMTGPAAIMGKWGSAGLQLAFDDINVKGGINGRNVRLIVEDSSAQPARAVTALKKLLTVDKVQVVFSIVSAVDLALIPVAEEAGVVFISHATHPEVTKNRTLVLRHANTVEQEVDLILGFLKNDDVMSGVTILHLNDDYGAETARRLAEELSRKHPGGKFETISYGRDETSFSAHVTKALANKPSTVIVAGLGKSSGLPIRRLREMDFQGKIVATLGFIVTGGYATAGDAAKGVWCVDFVPPPEAETTAVKSRYRKLTKDRSLPMGVLLFYNSALLWSRARIDIQSSKPLDVVNHIKEMGTFNGVGETITIARNGDMLPSLRVMEFKGQ